MRVKDYLRIGVEAVMERADLDQAALDRPITALGQLAADVRWGKRAETPDRRLTAP